MDNDSGMVTEEQWLEYINSQKQQEIFNKLFGVRHERTQQAESSTNGTTKHEAE